MKLRPLLPQDNETTASPPAGYKEKKGDAKAQVKLTSRILPPLLAPAQESVQQRNLPQAVHSKGSTTSSLTTKKSHRSF